MKNKTLVKTLKIITILAIIIFLFTPICLAGGTPTTIDPDEWKPDDLQYEDVDEVVDIAATIVEIIRIVGFIVAVITLLILGIKYMTGSIQEKAEYKNKMLPYLIGVVIFFALTQLLALILNLVTELE